MNYLETIENEANGLWKKFIKADGITKAFGETMAVLMVVGNVIQISGNPFDAAYPLPALIANNYGEMMSIPMYDSAMMFSALILLVIILGMNLFFRYVINKVTLK